MLYPANVCRAGSWSYIKGISTSSVESCSKELQTSFRFAYGDDTRVCSSSERGSNPCQRSVPFDAAAPSCGAIGARLCNIPEEAGKGKRSGCTARTTCVEASAECLLGEKIRGGIIAGRNGGAGPTCKLEMSWMRHKPDMILCCADRVIAKPATSSSPTPCSKAEPPAAAPTEGTSSFTSKACKIFV